MVLFGFFCAVSIVTLGTRTISPQVRPIPINIEEDWKPDLARVQSIDQAMQMLPAYIGHQRGTKDERITAGIDQFVRDRFFHGISLFSARENWIAALSGLAWINLRNPVRPDDILKHRRAICSQQAMVFMALLKRYGIEYGSVGFRWPGEGLDRGHFAVAAKVDGQWRFFDTDLEAAKVGVPLASVINGESLGTLYAGRPEYISKLQYAAAHGDIRLAHINQNPAPRGGAFQAVTAWLSAYGWLPLGALWLLTGNTLWTLGRKESAYPLRLDARVVCKIFGHHRSTARARMTDDGWVSRCKRCHAPMTRVRRHVWEVAS